MKALDFHRWAMRPKFVLAVLCAEFDAFLECGILAHGFVRLRCGQCAHEKLVAFSCYPEPETMKSSESRVRYLWDSPKDSLPIVPTGKPGDELVFDRKRMYPARTSSFP